MSWKHTAEGDRKYREARARAQKMANEDGLDRGLEASDYEKDYVVFVLPQARYRFGHELRCEVVSCEIVEKTAAGHGHRAHSDAVKRAS